MTVLAVKQLEPYRTTCKSHEDFMKRIARANNLHRMVTISQIRVRVAWTVHKRRKHHD